MIPKTSKKQESKKSTGTQAAAMIMLYCGLRRGEIIPLEWSDIDLITKQIAVTKSVERVDSNNFQVKAHTKNGKDRYLTIPDNIIPLLKLEKYQAKGRKLVFTQKSGKMHTVSSWQSSWDSYQNTLNYGYYCQEMRKLGRIPKHYNSPTGIPKLLQSFSPHQLRHTYCTMLYLAGIDALKASKLMGHSNVQITLDNYTHLDQKYKRIDMLNVAHFIGRITKEPELKTPTDEHNAPYCFFQLAVESENGETDFPELVCYNRIAKNLCEYAHKGDLVAVSGYYRSRFFKRKKYHNFVVYKIVFLQNKLKAGGDIDIPQSDNDD